MTLSPYFLEALNGFLLVQFFFIMWLFARYIIQGVYTYGWTEGRRQRAAAIGVFTLVTGDFIIRLSVWLWRHGVNTDNPPGPAGEVLLTAGTAVGVVIAAFGGACILRYFSPSRWGEWPWITVTIAAFTFSIVMAWVDF
jgi:hypothetical protein